EFDRYIAEPTVFTKDPLGWWWERRREYPRLSRMAIAYLTIPGTSVDIERIFSRGRLLLPHVRNGLSARSIRALLCLGEWSRLGLVKDRDVKHDLEDSDDDDDDGWGLLK
ncbi:hATC-domain-containing protein, partial [Polyporus arcularius HHB13444]